QYGSWFELARSMADLDEDNAVIAASHREFLRELETTSMTKSFKMVLLEAMQELDGWRVPPTLALLAERSWQILRRRRPLLRDLPEHLLQLADGAGTAWQRYWRDNPINAWVGGNRRAGAHTFFKVVDGCLHPT